MNHIGLLNIIPFYDCNLKCPHCFFVHLRNGKKLNTFKLINTLEKLVDEGVSRDIYFEWYGGEITLNCQLLICLFKASKKLFPFSKHSVVSNLISISSSFLSFLRDNFTHVTTSFEDLRFKRGSLLFKAWRKNVEMISRYMTVNLIIMANPHLTQESINTLADMPFSRVSVYPIKIPEDAPRKDIDRISRYTLSIEKTRDIKNKVEGVFGKERMSSQEAGLKIWNVLHILPDGSCALPAPSKKGFPHEKTVIFSGESILFSPERIRYITEQKTACSNCYMTDCKAEFRYPEVCVNL